MAAHPILDFTLSRLEPSPDGRLMFSDAALEELRAAFMKAGHGPDAEEAGRAVLFAVGLLESSGECKAAECLLELGVSVAIAVTCEDDTGAFARFSDRVVSFPSASPAEEGSVSARALIAPRGIRC